MPWPPFEIRFWRRVRRTRSCWFWTGPLLQDGYGQITFGGKVMPAHRAAYKFLVGTVCDDLMVLHTCNNRACVNPNHLYLGTAIDNNRDRDRDGRQARLRGELAGMARLTWMDIREIRRSYRSGTETYKSLGRRFRVDPTNIGHIIQERTWKEEWRPKNV